MKKDVLRLCLKFIILGIPLYVLMLLAFIFPMDFLPAEYPMWREESDYVRTGGEDPDIIIIGDSRAKSGIIPELLTEGTGRSAYNIAVGGCNAVEMYYALKHYLENHEAPEQAVVIFAPYHFCDIDNFGQTQTFNYLSVGELSEVYSQALGFGETQKLGDHFFTDVFSCKLRLPNKYLASIYEASLFGRGEENRKKYDSVRADRGYTEFGTESGNNFPAYEVHHPEFDSLHLVVLYYDRLLELADDNGIEVFALQSPVNEATSEGMSPRFRSGFGAFMEERAQRYPHFTVETQIPCYESRYFGDNNHLNREGAGVFTRSVKDRYIN